MPLVARIMARSGSSPTEIARYEDHTSLHDWMGEVFMGRGGESIEWEARTSLDLDAADVDLLEQMVGAPRRPIGYSQRSTWVNSRYTNEEARQADLAMIARCRQALASGHALSYVFTW